MINLSTPTFEIKKGRYLCVSLLKGSPEFATCNIAGGDMKPFIGCLPDGFEDATFLVSHSILAAIIENGGISHTTPNGNIETVDFRQFHK